jgi:hypothetical protein
MKYKFHPDALTEYPEAALWYADRERPVAKSSSPQLKMRLTELSKRQLAGGSSTKMYAVALRMFSLKQFFTLLKLITYSLLQ